MFSNIVVGGISANFSARDFTQKGKGVTIERNSLIISVPRTGIEPALPCENQILSLARLPIPPSGLMGCKCIYSFLNAQQVFFTEVHIFYPRKQLLISGFIIFAC